MGYCGALFAIVGLTALAGGLPLSAADETVDIERFAQAETPPKLELEVDAAPQPDRLRREAAERQREAEESESTGHVIDARSQYGEASDLYRQAGDRAGEAMVLLARGALERRLGNLDAASADVAAAQNIFNRLDDPVREVAALLMLGQLDLERQEYEFALSSLGRARHLFRQRGDRLGEADALAAMAEVERDLGDRDFAMRDFEMAADLYAAAGRPDRADWAFEQAAAMAE
jgi:tetratricopeptide (TPR) repeat protein